MVITKRENKNLSRFNKKENYIALCLFDLWKNNSLCHCHFPEFCLIVKLETSKE